MEKNNTERQIDTSIQKPVKRNSLLIKSIKAKADARRSLSEKIADWTTAKFGSVSFLVINTVFFAIWIVVNIGLTSIEPFDPFPFGLLTMIVSLEAIILAIFVLISQNREEKINSLRDEIGLQLEIISEQKTIKMLEILEKILKKTVTDAREDGTTEEMLKPTNIEKIEHILERQIK